MNHRMKTNSSERGVALIFALVAVLVLTVLAATIMFTSQSQTWTTANYRQTAQARYAAESGVQATINWLSSSAYPTPSMSSFTTTTAPVQYNGSPVILSTVSGASNYPDSTVVSAFASVGQQSLPGVSNASFTTTAQLMRITNQTGVPWLQGPMPQTWKITSTGSIGGITTSSIQMVETYERITGPVFTSGLETTSNACGSITFNSSGSYTDSYNSNNGAYSATNSQASGGNIQTNGNVYLGSGVTVNGNITAENTTVATSNQAGTNPPCTNGITNRTGHTTFDLNTYKENATLVAKLPWGCSAQPCYPPAVDSTHPNITTAQNVNSSCGSIAGCTTGTAVNVYDGTGSNHAGSTIAANVYTLAPGSYGNLVIGNTSSNSADVTVVHVSAGIYNINSIDMGSSDAQVVVDSGPVVFNMVGNCSSGCPTESGLPSGFSSTEIVHISGAGGLNACQPSGGTGTVANPGQYGYVTCGHTGTTPCTSLTTCPFSGIPSNMQFVYGGTNTVRLGGMPFAAAIYAPSAGYYTPGAPVGLYGSVIASMFNDSSGSPWHYDNALGQAGMKVGGYRSLGFSWVNF